MTDQPSLHLPARAATRRIGLTLLEDWERTRDRLEESADPDALHDFRVALRRLRSVLRAFRPASDEVVPRGLRRRLRRLADATGDSRDLGVLRAWLAARIRELPPDQRAGAGWLDSALQPREVEANQRLRRTVARWYAPVTKRLRARLSATEDEPASDAGNVAASGVAGATIIEWAGDMEYRLGAIRSIAEVTQAHTARILVKRLKYLLTALAPELPAAAALVPRLARLQDLLGDLHDRHRFGEELEVSYRTAATLEAQRVMHDLLPWVESSAAAEPAPPADAGAGLAAVAGRLRAEADAIFGQLRSEWLEGTGGFDLIQALQALGRALEGESNAPLEIERKYLLSALPPRALLLPGQEIDQGWLPGVELVERIRRVRSGEGEHYFRTVKSGQGLSRVEIEEETTQALFEALWPLTEGRRVHKRRYRVAEGGFFWEVDEFLDRELAVAEVELPTPRTRVEIPAWLSGYVVREVTEEPTYANRALAR